MLNNHTNHGGFIGTITINSAYKLKIITKLSNRHNKFSQNLDKLIFAKYTY